MVRICMYCHKILGEKEPLDDKSETHGMCDSCADLFEEGFFNGDPYRILRQKGEHVDH